MGAAAAAARLAGELGDPVTAGLFCGESGGVASDVLWNSTPGGRQREGDWPVGVAWCRAGPEVGRPWGRGGSGPGSRGVGIEWDQSDEHRWEAPWGGGARSVLRARRCPGWDRARRGRHDSWRQPTVGEGCTGSGSGRTSFCDSGEDNQLRKNSSERSLDEGNQGLVTGLIDVAWGSRCPSRSGAGRRANDVSNDSRGGTRVGGRARQVERVLDDAHRPLRRGRSP